MVDANTEGDKQHIPHTGPAAAAAGPVPISHERPMTDVQADIAKILADAQLPERRSDPPVKKTSPPPPPAPTIPSPQPAPQPEGSVVPIRTLRHDLQSVVADSKLSLVQAAALEADKRAHSEPAPVEMHTDRARHYTKPLVIGSILLTLGGLLLGAVMLIITEQSAGSAPAFGTDFIFSEQVVPFPLGGNPQDIKRSLGAARSSGGLTLGSITRIVPTLEKATEPPSEREATAEEFLTALGAQVPDELLRATEEQFFFGFHTVDEQAPILVFHVTSYERAYAALLQWEKTLNADLSPVFSPLTPLIKDSTGRVVERRFSDTVMQNFDMRTLRDDAGVIQLYYSFPTRSLLIIAESQYSFPEILSRLRAERKL